MSLTQEQLYQKCLGAVLKFVSRQRKTKLELSKKIDSYLSHYTQEFTPAELETIKTAVFERLETDHLVDDYEYASVYVEQQLMAKKPKSKRELSAFLHQKGISRELIDEVTQVYTPEQEARIVANAIDTQLKTYQKVNQELSPQLQKQKVITYLITRGFTASVVYEQVDTKIKLP